VIITTKIADVRAHRQRERDMSWGFVPTMGYLHAGHLSLVEKARADNERTAVSIYVNPTQFGPQEDFGAYPRAPEQDLAMLEKAGVHLVFTPGDSTIYPPGFQTTISLRQVSRPLEGASRPGHFDGVATVVAKLFNIVQPDRAYFGQKDAQQVVVLRRMVTDLNFPLDVVVCPTVRESDGLALSSRNAYLSAKERQASTVLYRALKAAEDAFYAGERQADSLRALMSGVVGAESLARLDYVSVAHPDTLVELEVVAEKALLSLAVFFGRTRLIDNVLIDVRNRSR
jgi:pantoate--beta-alanine ligase